jgi:hypothetical protein
MEAGRELDALVAEKVMGWVWQPDEKGGHYRDGNGETFATGRTLGQPECPKYSTSIAAAWDVVELLASKGLDVTVFVHPDGRAATCEIGFKGDLGIEPTADTAPHAICLAALKAVVA